MCLSVSDHVFGTARPTSTKCLVNVRLHTAVARCSSGGVAIRYVLPVFMEDVIFAQLARRRRQAEAQCTRSLGLDYKLCAVIPAADQRTHGTTFTTTTFGKCAFRCSASAVWNSLPKTVLSSDSVVVFKYRLKTFLFSQAFFSSSAHLHVAWPQRL